MERREEGRARDISFFFSSSLLTTFTDNYDDTSIIITIPDPKTVTEMERRKEGRTRDATLGMVFKIIFLLSLLTTFYR
jgi:hypothetical protein